MKEDLSEPGMDIEVLAKSLPMHEVPWREVFTPAEIESLVFLHTPTIQVSGTDVVSRYLTQDFTDLMGVRNFLLTEFNEVTLVMPWVLRACYPCSGHITSGADSQKLVGYRLFYGTLPMDKLNGLEK